MTSITRLSTTYRDLYRNRFRNVDYRQKVWLVLVESFFQKYVKPTDSVLDLGCGYCGFINNINCAGKIGMDLNPDSGNHLDDEVLLLECDCTASWPISAGTVDVVFTSNFFEHLFNQAALAETLAEAYRCLSPGGKLIAMGPNIRRVHGKYWDIWDHYLPLSNLSLAEGMKLAGFKIVENHESFLPMTMNDGREFPMWMIKLYLKLPFLWRFFGKQFLIVAVK